MQRFSNNASAALAAVLGGLSGDETLTIDNVDDLEAFVYLDGTSSDIQMATLTHESLPGVHEIVAIREHLSDGFIATRGQEDTPVREWPAGTKVEARVTAGMLRSFLQIDGERISTPTSDLIINGRRSSDATGLVQIAGFPILQYVGASGVRSPAGVDRNLSHEVICSTGVVSVGATPAWEYKSNRPTFTDVVKPIVPNGLQYNYQPLKPYDTIPAGEPSWVAFHGASMEVYSAGGILIGHWVATEEPLDLGFSLNAAPMLITEVGFICSAKEAGGSAPAVTITLNPNSTPVVVATTASLSDATDYATIHRFPVASGGALCTSIGFQLNTASDAEMVGRFYWRGCLIEV